MKLILGSGSPRRKELLQMLEVPFTVRTADIDEQMIPGADPEQEVARVCRAKAEAVRDALGGCPADTAILTADTIVCIGNEILGKPHTEEIAVQMLRELSGKTHLVRTGITLLTARRTETRVETTEVVFRNLTEEEIARYAASAEPLDKAGAYGIQGKAAVFIEAIHGDYYNVMGLPLCRLTTLMDELGMPIASFEEEA